ncbi:MAG TPA: DUF3078 domain-containing protein [Balneolaceae bacterium]
MFLFALAAIPALGQEAIQISELLDSDREISISDISRVNRQVNVSDTLQGWQFEWYGNLNGSQAAYNNWSSGGVNTISVTAATAYNMRYRYNQFAYAFAFNVEYGKARIDGEGTRKTNDRIAINNKFSYLFPNKNWSFFGNINFSTQVDQGYDYDVPEGEPPELVSNFLAPAYFTQIAGVAYSSADFYSVEAGLALKETIVIDTTLSERYGLDPAEQFRFEPGYAFAVNFEKNVFSNVRLRSSIETFTNLQRPISSTDVYFNSELVGKINDFMNMSFSFVLIYDDDFSKQVQIKQVLSAGLSVEIL